MNSGWLLLLQEIETHSVYFSVRTTMTMKLVFSWSNECKSRIPFTLEINRKFPIQIPRSISSFNLSNSQKPQIPQRTNMFLAHRLEWTLLVWIFYLLQKIDLFVTHPISVTHCIRIHGLTNKFDPFVVYQIQGMWDAS